jgi:hypothetical protein
VLDANPGTNGILFDLPGVVERSGTSGSDRLLLQSGDFFRDPLPSCDTYFLMHVIHNWADQACVMILQAVRNAMTKKGKLLIIETLLPEIPKSDPAVVRLDVQMLAITGGRERAMAEYEALLTQADFSLRRVINTDSGMSILEAVSS